MTWNTRNSHFCDFGCISRISIDFQYRTIYHDDDNDDDDGKVKFEI